MNCFINECGHHEEPTACEHFVMCEDCRNDHGCQKCRRIAQDERGADLW